MSHYDFIALVCRSIMVAFVLILIALFVIAAGVI